MTAPLLRPLRLDDMPAAAALQNAVYAPLYHEPAEILASRVIAAPRLCWGAFVGEALTAYILSHPWPAGSPPPIGLSLPTPPPTDSAALLTVTVTRSVAARRMVRIIRLCWRRMASS